MVEKESLRIALARHCIKLGLLCHPPIVGDMIVGLSNDRINPFYVQNNNNNLKNEEINNGYERKRKWTGMTQFKWTEFMYFTNHILCVCEYAYFLCICMF